MSRVDDDGRVQQVAVAAAGILGLLLLLFFGCNREIRCTLLVRRGVLSAERILKMSDMTDCREMSMLFSPVELVGPELLVILMVCVSVEERGVIRGEESSAVN